MKMPTDRRLVSTVRQVLFALLLISIASTALHAASGEIRRALPSLTEQQYSQLSDGEMVYGLTTNGGTIGQFFPSDSEVAKRALVAQQIEKGFALGAVSYIPYPPTLSGMGQAERQVAIFNALRAISTQEGLTYISWRAGNKEKLLIERSSYMADSKNLNTLLPDPVVSVLPPTAHSYVYQRDTSFGGNRYEHTYINSDREIFVTIENLSSMRVLGIFTALKSGQLSINMGTYQLEDGLLLYALTSVEGRDPVVSALGLSVDLPSAFRRRIVSLQSWLIGQLNII